MRIKLLVSAVSVIVLMTAGAAQAGEEVTLLEGPSVGQFTSLAGAATAAERASALGAAAEPRQAQAPDQFTVLAGVPATPMSAKDLLAVRASFVIFIPSTGFPFTGVIPASGTGNFVPTGTSEVTFGCGGAPVGGSSCS